MPRSRRRTDPLLTIEEAIAALDRLEPRAAAAARAAGRAHVLTPRQLRYLASAERGILPALRVIGSAKSGRYLYRAEDLVLLRVLVRVTEHRAAWQAWSAVAYLGDALRDAITHRRSVALVFRGGARAVLVPLRAPEAQTDEAFSLVDCAVDVENVVRQILRARADDIWTGCRRIPSRELAMAVGG